MGNHAHHLIEIGETPLSKVMQNILFRYTRYWNRRYGVIGHLFQGRYKAILCDKESYLLELIRYIHLNPVRSKKVKDASLYPWSSHGAYIKGEGRDWIAVEEILSRFGKRPTEAIRRYQRFVREGIPEGHREEYYQVVNQRYLGEEEFIEKVEQRVLEKERPRSVEIKWGEIQEAVCKQYGRPVGAVMHRGRDRETVRMKRIMAWVGREVGGMSNQEMAREIKVDPAVLSRGLGRLAEEFVEDKGLQNTVSNLCKALRKGRQVKRARRFA
jgi:hypothetical protein